MKRFRAAIFLVLFLGSFAAHAEGPDEEYVMIYNSIQRGDALKERGETQLAVSEYTRAQNDLLHFQSAYPDWNLKIVKYRLKYLSAQISDLAARAKEPAGNAPVENLAPKSLPSAGAPFIIAPATAPVAAPASTMPPMLSESENQIKGLREQIRRMEVDKAMLEAKLKEAFATQPAAISPQELDKAKSKVVELQKQNDLLTASLAESKSAGTSSASFEKLRRELADASQKVVQLSAANASLQMDKDALQAQVNSLSGGSQDVVVLRSENDLLKKDLAELKTKVAAIPPSAPDNSAVKLQEAQAQLAVLQSEKEVLNQEKETLENRVKQLSAAAMVAATNAAPPVVASNSSTNVGFDDFAGRRIAELEIERVELKKSLDAATKDVAGRKKGKALAARLDDLTREVSGLKARIGVMEAKSVPYSPDELDVLNKPATVLIGASAHHPTAGNSKMRKSLPSGASALVAEGQRFFLDHHYDQAEQKYEAVLAMDPKNVVTLADLASVQLEAGHLNEAEQNLKDALAIDPNDDYSLYVLGQVKFQQKDYDAALTALSRASDITPRNANIKNFVGLALSEKGLRSEAETAFRGAIQLDPEFAEAHMNLAVVYAMQKPPLIQLAKWHYQKAMAIGHTPNLALEKMLDEVTATSAAVPAH